MNTKKLGYDHKIFGPSVEIFQNDAFKIEVFFSLNANFDERDIFLWFLGYFGDEIDIFMF